MESRLSFFHSFFDKVIPGDEEVVEWRYFEELESVWGVSVSPTGDGVEVEGGGDEGEVELGGLRKLDVINKGDVELGGLRKLDVINKGDVASSSSAGAHGE